MMVAPQTPHSSPAKTRAASRPLATFRADVQAREKVGLGAHIDVSWTGLQVSDVTSSQANVAVTLTESAYVDGSPEKLSSQWLFGDQRAGDWRVCSAVKVG